MCQVGAGIRIDAGKFLEIIKYLLKRKLGGSPHQWGLASLAEKLLSKQSIKLPGNRLPKLGNRLQGQNPQLKKPKNIILGNWEAPVLSKEQLEYAATDAFASWHLYQDCKCNQQDSQVTILRDDQQPGPTIFPI
ncbi:hypothetical protein PIB30_078238 [Stylosanthes scabra]|uniref:3'-5' exonuclease domain-containing protein n=1 Tax=Stylosanthes scabra TaxID=79078 RepID=A0ABU6SRL7_9FABA|nr:hypothetical protein [Stylosanthes scabra]